MKIGKNDALRTSVQEHWIVCCQILMCEGLTKLDMQFNPFASKTAGCDPYAEFKFGKRGEGLGLLLPGL